VWVKAVFGFGREAAEGGLIGQVVREKVLGSPVISGRRRCQDPGRRVITSTTYNLCFSVLWELLCSSVFDALCLNLLFFLSKRTAQ
jgi:hypothetical protein